MQNVAVKQPKKAFIKRCCEVFRIFSFILSLAWMQYMCSFKSERKQIERFKTSSSATVAVTQNLFFHLSSSAVGLIVWEKAVSHQVFVFCMWFLFEFILISATLYHARAQPPFHRPGHHFDLFICGKRKRNVCRLKMDHLENWNISNSLHRPLGPFKTYACVCVCANYLTRVEKKGQTQNPT